MALYHFHFRLGPMVGLDQQGTELGGVEDAVPYAFMKAIDRFNTISGRARAFAAIEVTDHAGKHLFSVPLSAVISSGRGCVGERPGQGVR